VDLYKVVREGLRVSEPRYSLKNMEVFYMESRSGEVKTAGDSIVVYERWRDTRHDDLLEEIAQYNEFDCRSTALLRDWLLKLRPSGVPWFEAAEKPDEEKTQARQEAELRRSGFERNLLKNISEKELRVRRLTAQLLEFHRREAKPQWWATFDRQGRSEEELIDDAECLGSLRMDRSVRPFPKKRSMVYTYEFPPQDYKFQAGDNCLISDSLDPAGTVFFIDADSRKVQIKRGAKNGGLPDSFSIIPAGPMKTKVLTEAVYRFAGEMVSGLISRIPNTGSSMTRRCLMNSQDNFGQSRSRSVIHRKHYTPLFCRLFPGSDAIVRDFHMLAKECRYRPFICSSACCIKA
jgi:hypothetical protein